MAHKRKFKSDAFEAIHASATALHKVGAIDKTTMRGFDESCLAPPPALKPGQIKKLRMRLRVSQPVQAPPAKWRNKALHLQCSLSVPLWQTRQP